MSSPNASVFDSKASIWTGRILSTLIVLLLLVDCLFKFLQPPQVVEGMHKLGLPPAITVPLGILLMLCTLLYAIPYTSVLGAVLLTGYFGGAVLTHLRVSEPLFTHTLFPVYFGILAWFALFLRDPRIRALLPFRT